MALHGTAPYPSQGRWHRAPELGLIALCCLGFWRVLGNGYTFDDVSIVLANRSVHHLRSWPRLFTQDYWAPAHHWGLYRPLTVLSFALEWALRPGNPALPHLVNLALHAAVVVLLYRWMKSWVVPWAAWIGAAWFALTPLHVEVVAGVVGRSDLLATLGVLAALMFAQRAALRPARWGWGAAAAASAALALLAKESAIIVVGLLGLQWLTLQGWHAIPRLARQPVLWLVVAVDTVYLAVRMRVVGLLLPSIPYLDNPLAYASTAERVGTAVKVFFSALGACLWPFRLAPDYSYAAVPVLRYATTPIVPALVAGVVALAWLLIALRRERLLLLGAGFFLLTYLPTSNVLFPIGTVRANRLLYLPSVGIAVLIAGLAACLARRRPGNRLRRIGFATALLVLVAYAVVDQQEVGMWRDNQTLFAMAVARSPRSAKAHFAWGLTLETTAPRVAAVQYRTALAIFPRYAAADLQLGRLLVRSGDGAEGVLFLRQAFALAPAPRSFEALAAAELDVGHDDAVIRAARSLSSELPGPAATLLAEALLRRGNPRAALQALGPALHTTPEQPLPHLYAARALQALGQPGPAADELRRARALALSQMAAPVSPADAD